MKKLVLITGAAGGLGKSLTGVFHQKGWNVIATDVVPIEQDDNRAISGIRSFEMDITSNDSVNEVYRCLKAENTTIQLIINNAGIDRYFSFSEKRVENFQKVFEVNVFGAYRVNQIFLPILQKPGGRIVHIGSESLNITVPFMPYPLSKKLLEGYARVLRQELKFLGIDVTVVRPGTIDTLLLEQVRQLKAENGDLLLSKQFNKFSTKAGMEIGKAISTVTAAEFVYKISVIPRPRHLYRIHNNLKLRIAAFLPFNIMENLIHDRLS